MLPLILVVSERERRRRRESNRYSTKVNFLAWLVEVNILNIWFDVLCCEYLNLWISLYASVCRGEYFIWQSLGLILKSFTIYIFLAWLLFKISYQHGIDFNTVKMLLPNTENYFPIYPCDWIYYERMTIGCHSWY